MAADAFPSPAQAPQRAPVLIVGAGPAGLTTALALGRMGVRSIVLTRHLGLAHTPRAHITNQRTLEILADLGVEEEARARGRVLEEMPYSVFLMSMEGPEVARTTAWGAGLKDQTRYRRASRHLPLNLFQHELEPVLARAALATGMVDLRYGHEFLSLTQDDGGADATIKAVSTWSISHAAADQYSVGRVFGMGDAVHRHPPANGLGSNTSIADGHNLAWKLHLVLTGLADASLLDTYSGERAPVGRQIVDRVFTSVGEVFSIGATIGLRPEMTQAEKWATVRALDEATEEGARRRAALAEAMRLMDYNFNAHGVELGYRYAVPAAHDDTGEDRGTVDELEYRPSTAPGEHLPHAWVEFNRRRMSTVDLVGQGRFTLITGRRGEAWAGAVDRASALYGLPIVVRVIGADRAYRDPLGEWASVRGIEDDGCLLVRPDGHIAWRARSGPDPDALLDAVARTLGIPAPQDGRAAGKTFATAAH